MSFKLKVVKLVGLTRKDSNFGIVTRKNSSRKAKQNQANSFAISSENIGLIFVVFN